MAKQYKKIYRFNLYNTSGRMMTFAPVPAITNGDDLLQVVREIGLQDVYKIDFIVARLTFDTGAPLNTLSGRDVEMSGMAGMPLSRVTGVERVFTCFVTDQLRTVPQQIYQCHRKFRKIDGVRVGDGKYAVVDWVGQMVAHVSQNLIRNVSMHTLVAGDVVVNRDMNQIYPHATNALPRGLAKMLGGAQR